MLMEAEHGSDGESAQGAVCHDTDIPIRPQVYLNVLTGVHQAQPKPSCAAPACQATHQSRQNQVSASQTWVSKAFYTVQEPTSLALMLSTACWSDALEEHRNEDLLAHLFGSGEAYNSFRSNPLFDMEATSSSQPSLQSTGQPSGLLPFWPLIGNAASSHLLPPQVLPSPMVPDSTTGPEAAGASLADALHPGNTEAAGVPLQLHPAAHDPVTSSITATSVVAPLASTVQASKQALTPSHSQAGLLKGDMPGSPLQQIPSLASALSFSSRVSEPVRLTHGMGDSR